MPKFKFLILFGLLLLISACAQAPTTDKTADQSVKGAPASSQVSVDQPVVV
jgi:hypothetical protein